MLAHGTPTCPSAQRLAKVNAYLRPVDGQSGNYIRKLQTVLERSQPDACIATLKTPTEIAQVCAKCRLPAFAGF